MKKDISKQIYTFVAVMAAGMLFAGNVFAQVAADESEKPVAETVVDEDVMELTVEEAVNYANEHSLSLQASALDLELAKWKNSVSWNTFLPTVQISGSLARANNIKSTIDSANKTIDQQVAQYQALSAIPGAYQPYYKYALSKMPGHTEETESMHWSAMGNLSIQFSFNASMIVSMKSTKEAYESGKITYEQAVKSNEMSVRKLFYSLLLQQESLKLQKDSLENARQRMNQASVNYRNGYVPQIQFLQAEVAYENMVPSVEKAALQMQQSIDNFSFLIGLPVGQKVQLKGEINPEYIDAEIEDLITKANANNLTVKALRQSINSLKLQATSLDLLTYTPNLVASWNGQPMITDAFKNDWSKSDNWKDGGALSFTLAWNLTNMLPWSSSRTSAKEIRTNIEKMELNLKSLERNTELEVRRAVDTLSQCKRSIESSERNITLAQNSYNMTWQAYRNGTTEYLNLVEAQTQLNQAKLALVSEKFNYMTSLMDLENILNTTLTGDR